MTKYVQLDHLESGWKHSYLLKRHQEGEWITRYPNGAQHRQAMALLEDSKNFLKPPQMNAWIEQHLNPDLCTRLNQALRARRKRYFDRENFSEHKKSIDLTHKAWVLLSEYKEKNHLATLSQALIHLLEHHIALNPSINSHSFKDDK